VPRTQPAMATRASGSCCAKRPVWHILGIRRGLIWCTGSRLNLVASRSQIVGPAISYRIDQDATMISAILGVFICKDLPLRLSNRASCSRSCSFFVNGRFESDRFGVHRSRATEKPGLLSFLRVMKPDDHGEVLACIRNPINSQPCEGGHCMSARHVH
jgi:hypothetical protein